MSADLLFRNLLAYSLQLAVVVGAGMVLPWLLRLRRPRVLYGYFRGLLGLCLLLPFLQSWCPPEMAERSSAFERILPDFSVPGSQVATFSLAQVSLIVVAAGVALHLAWLILGLLKLRRYADSARRLEPAPAEVHDLAARLAIRPRICLSVDLTGPVTFGFWQPLVLLPRSFGEMDSARQQAIVSHELLHVARRDWVANLGEEFVLAALWFHPALWWLVGRIRLAREQVVDQQVVALTGDRAPYLYALLEIAAGPAAVRALVAPMFLRERQLVARIRSLIQEDVMSKRRMVILLGCALIVVLFAGVAVIRQFPLTLAGEPEFEATPGLDGPHVYKVGNGVSVPVPISKPEPPYTPEAKAAKIQGTVVMQAVIAADGSVSGVKVKKPLDKGLDANAVNTIKSWKFHPAMKDGKPVACRVMIEVSFRIF